MRFPHVALRKGSTDPCRFHRTDYSLSLQGIDHRNRRSRIYNITIQKEVQPTFRIWENKISQLPLCSSAQGAIYLPVNLCLLPFTVVSTGRWRKQVMTERLILPHSKTTVSIRPERAQWYCGNGLRKPRNTWRYVYIFSQLQPQSNWQTSWLVHATS